MLKITFCSKIPPQVFCNDPSFRFSFHANKIVKFLLQKILAKLWVVFQVLR